MQFALKDFGSEAIAGYSIALRIEQLLLLPVLGVTHALLPVVAQNFGAVTQNFGAVSKPLPSRLKNSPSRLKNSLNRLETSASCLKFWSRPQTVSESSQKFRENFEAVSKPFPSRLKNSLNRVKNFASCLKFP